MRLEIIGRGATVWGLALLVACNGATTDVVDKPDPQTTGDTGEETTPPVGIVDLVGHLEGFDVRHVKEQGYWYSRFNLGSLVMKSANGTTFPVDPKMAADMAASVSDATSTATPPMNAALLSRVYDMGAPQWVSPDNGDPMDLLDERWDVPLSTTTSAASAGWTIQKELEWAKQFHVDDHFGDVGDASGIPGAQQRFEGLVMYVGALMQSFEWINNPAAFDTSDPGGQYVMLEALSNIAWMSTATAMPGSTNNRYLATADGMAPMVGLSDGPAVAAALMTAADALYTSDPAVSTIEDRSIAVQALAWYAKASSANQSDALARMTTLADGLAAEAPANATEHAYVVRAMVEADRLIGGTYMDTAAASFAAMEADFDWAQGTFGSVATYTPERVAAILGAVNAMLVFGDPYLNTTPMMEHFFEAVVNLSGMQIAAPPYDMIPAYEQFDDELFHRYPTVPVPPMAGGKYGTAPVLASSATWDGTAWTVTPEFDTAGSMHLANEMIWLHVDEVSGFPEL